jgi:ketosteroid isomerase-like protein
MAFDPVARLIEYHAATSAFDFAAVEKMFAEDAVYDSGGLGGIVTGRGPIMQGFRDYFDAYSDQTSEDSVIEKLDDNSVRAVWTSTATHRKTGEKLLRSGIEITTFNDDGLIVKVEVIDLPA